MHIQNIPLTKIQHSSLLEQELQLDQIAHSNLFRIVHDVLVVVQSVSFRIEHLGRFTWTHGDHHAVVSIRTQIIEQLRHARHSQCHCVLHVGRNRAETFDTRQAFGQSMSVVVGVQQFVAFAQSHLVHVQFRGNNAGVQTYFGEEHETCVLARRWVTIVRTFATHISEVKTFAEHVTSLRERERRQQLFLPRSLTTGASGGAIRKP